MAYQGLDVGNYFSDQRDRDYAAAASQAQSGSLFGGGRRQAASAGFGSALSGLQSGLQSIGGNSTVGIQGLTGGMADQYNAEAAMGQSALAGIAEGIALDKQLAFAKKNSNRSSAAARGPSTGDQLKGAAISIGGAAAAAGVTALI